MNGIPAVAFGDYEVVFVLLAIFLLILAWFAKRISRLQTNLLYWVIVISVFVTYSSITLLRYWYNPSHKLLGYGTLAFSSSSYLLQLEKDLKKKLVGKGSSEVVTLMQDAGFSCVLINKTAGSNGLQNCHFKDEWYFVARESWTVNFSANKEQLTTDDVKVIIRGGVRI